MAIRDACGARDGGTRKGQTGSRVVSLRVDYAQHRRLRRFIADYEDETGQRVTQQAVLEIALAEYLAQNEPPLS